MKLSPEIFRKWATGYLDEFASMLTLTRFQDIVSGFVCAFDIIEAIPDVNQYGQIARELSKNYNLK